MKFDLSFLPDVEFFPYRDQTVPLILIIVLALAAVLFVGRAAAWMHERWMMRKMKHDNAHSKSHISKAR